MAPAPKPSTSMVRQTPPNQTLYCKNLPDKLPKQDLKRNLFMLFTTYGVVLDIIALKTAKMRGQAHVVFRSVESSTQALRALQGFVFFGKEMNISYAKGKAHTIAKLDGTFKLPTKEEPVAAAPGGKESGMTSLQQSVFGGGGLPPRPKVAQGTKRTRDEESEKEESEGDDDEDAAMDVSDSD